MAAPSWIWNTPLAPPAPAFDPATGFPWELLAPDFILTKRIVVAYGAKQSESG